MDYVGWGLAAAAADWDFWNLVLVDDGAILHSDELSQYKNDIKFKMKKLSTAADRPSQQARIFLLDKIIFYILLCL